MAMIRLHSDLKEFLNVLNAHGVEYMVVGGYAVSYHGYPRATADLDVWVSREPANARRVFLALSEFGTPFSGMTEKTFEDDAKIVHMGQPPLRIEIMTAVSGLDFRQAFPRSVKGNLDGVDATIIGLDDLKANKKAAGRHKDLNDVQHLS